QTTRQGCIPASIPQASSSAPDFSLRRRAVLDARAKILQAYAHRLQPARSNPSAYEERSSANAAAWQSRLRGLPVGPPLSSERNGQVWQPLPDGLMKNQNLRQNKACNRTL